jgi:transposase
MEATGFYPYIYETIEARGFQVTLAHPLKLKALTAGRAKIDHTDAEMLAELLRINAIPASYVPPKEIGNLRDLTRHRSSLVAESTTLKNKIHAELAMKGKKPPAEARSPFSKKFISWLRFYEIQSSTICWIFWRWSRKG